jgi:hypothetical protein
MFFYKNFVHVYSPFFLSRYSVDEFALARSRVKNYVRFFCNVTDESGYFIPNNFLFFASMP